MKSDDIRREVRPARLDRAAGDAPSIGKVARMPGTGLPRGVRRRKRKSEGESAGRERAGRARVIATWSFLLTAVIFVVLGVAVWLWLVPQMTRKQDASARATVLPVEVARKVQVISKFPSPTQPEALAWVRQALAVRQVEDVGNYFRMGSATPQAVVDFLENLESTDGAFVRSDWLSSMDANGLSLDGVQLRFQGINKPCNRIAFLTPNIEGKWQLDFEAFARTATPAWKDLLTADAPQLGRVRIYLAGDSYYNGSFKDESQWACYGMGSVDLEQVLFGYCRVGSPQAAAIDWMLSQKRRVTRATLELRRVEGAEPRQFEIAQVLAEDWVLGPVALEKQFD